MTASTRPIPAPLDTDGRIVVRGWLATDSDRRAAIVHLPGERSDAGVLIASSAGLETGTRYDISGELRDGIVVITRAEPSAVQARPVIDDRRARELGLSASIPLPTWRRINEEWDHSPLEDVVVSGWGTFFGPATSDEIRTVLGDVVVVRWVSPELHEWLRTVPPTHSLAVIPLASNSWGDLIP